MPVGTHQEMRRARFQTLIARGELIRKAAWFWTFGEGHRRPACVRRGAPWFEWAWFEYTSLRTAETAMPPFFCSAKSNFKETFVSIADPAILPRWPSAKVLGQHFLPCGHCALQLRAQSLCVRGGVEWRSKNTRAARGQRADFSGRRPAFPAAPARDHYASVPLGFFLSPSPR